MFGSFLRIGVAALTIVASTQAFARGEGGGGGSGGSEGGAGETAFATTAPQPPTIQPPAVARNRTTVVIQHTNCKLDMRQLRFC